MLRISVHDAPREVTFKLEGKLSGPWLHVLEESWRRTLACGDKPVLRVDLTGLTFVDEVGKACLATMHRQGAEFVVNDCLNKAIVAEIHASSSDQRDRCPSA
jgi:hypothetical protein